MLKQRIISAVVMISIFTAILFATSPIIFTLFVAVVFLVGAWEWSRLSGFSTVLSQSLYVITVGIFSALTYLFIYSSYAFIDLKSFLVVASAFWALGLLWIQGYPESTLLWGRQYTKALMGFWVIVPAWISCVFLIDMPNGSLMVLSVVLLVACADIGAYFSGKKFGKNKLASKVSPGKSWEGVFGGMVVTVIFGVFFMKVMGVESWILKGIIIAIPIAVISVIGDLLESMMKREAKMKDSSQLIPGHGGVMDRLDGLVAAVPLFVLILLSMRDGLVV